MDIVKILLAIFLPPVAAFMQVGPTLHFWVNIVLTLLGGVPRHGACSLAGCDKEIVFRHYSISRHFRPRRCLFY